MGAPDEDANASAEPINLMRGWPSTTLLPMQAVEDAANAALNDPSIAIPGLSYGPDPGYEPLRAAISKWLTDFYQPATPITASRLAITGGASQNLACMLSVFTDPAYTRKIWIVAPAYMLAFRMFEDAGFAGKMRAVREEEDGADLPFLRREMEASEQEARRQGNDKPVYKRQRPYAKVYKHVVYCVPTFANPSSRTMSLACRRGLVRLARQYDALVVCDDVYEQLQWPAGLRGRDLSRSPEPLLTTAHLPRVVDVDRDWAGGAERDAADGFGNVASNGSFSKIVGPGMRVGWVEGTAKFVHGVSQTGATVSGGAPSQLTSTYVTHMLATGALQRHIRDRLLPSYARRYATLMRAIHSHLLPLGCSLPQSKLDVVGGYFVWLTLPVGMLATELASRCRDVGVIVAPGWIFEVPGDESVRFDGDVRLCFAWEAEGRMEEGVREVAKVMQAMIHGTENGGGASRTALLGQSDGRDISEFW